MMRFIPRIAARLAVGAWCCMMLAAVAPTATAGPAVTAVETIAITVADLERARRFYTEVLDFEAVDEYEVTGAAWEALHGVFGLRVRGAHLRLGEERIELREFLAPAGRPVPPDTRSNDRWFQHIAIVVSDMTRAYAHLREHRVRHASSGPQRLPAWNHAAAGIEAFYFRDPDGHHLEVLRFPPGKGAPRWQHSGDRLFLGIDHTAIVVADTARSLAYYRDTLGLAVAGTSENYGSEQEHLNNVFGARLRITTLRAAAGPGVELLEYLAPAGGRAMPADTQANDLWHWEVMMRASDIAGLPLSPRRAGTVVDLPEPEPEPVLAALRARRVRDPDGHAGLLLEAGVPVVTGAGR